ncbi:unnamed protein product [Adineta steineri]|uniref:Uncharacterized protein n=1 Tax=Adineta steineri TaxID=433720 RepID=A0A819IAY5_9BILA|nr:unnamed protein product [Adineta steineri]CAF3913496.1 unnamed protein product [Adineta steineri]
MSGADVIQFDCLHYYVHDENTDTRYDISIKQVIKYCIRLTDDFDVPIRYFSAMSHRNFTFEQLRYLNVTIEQLLSWSASIDLVERYFLYMIESLINNSLSNEVFYNCTGSWFGSQCQYSFMHDNKDPFSLVVDNKFQQMTTAEYSAFTIMNLTCYNHLKCDRGGKDLCLDWREICDGRIDCMNDGVDEAECFLMEINECKQDEYRCHNGLCIPKEFLKDDKDNPDCLDRSDESNIPSPSFNLCYQIPTFRCEEHTCRAGDEDFSCGDGQCVEEFDTCKNGRHELLKKSLLIQGDLSDKCWLYLACFSLIIDTYDRELCRSVITSLDKDNANLSMCESLFQFPQIFAFLGYIRFFYQNNQSVIYEKKIFQDGLLFGQLNHPKPISLASLPLWLNPHIHSGSSSTQLGLSGSVIKPIIPSFWDLLYPSGEVQGVPLYAIHRRPNSSFFGPEVGYIGESIALATFFNILLPSIICYDRLLCNFISPLFQYNNLACLYRDQLNLSETRNYRDFLLAVKNYFRGCLTTYNNPSQLNSSLYCCQNSSKCISKHRLLDGIKDCHMGDDETSNLSCSLNDSFRFQCDEKENQCFSPLIDKKICKTYLKNHINKLDFQDICDGIDDLLSQEINKQNYTDETECDYWPCNNAYTRCDYRLACSNGEDEENCLISDCPSHTHPCVSLDDLTLICLPFEEVNDGYIDCLGASDELEYCSNKNSDLNNEKTFYCSDDDICIPSLALCDKEYDCKSSGDDEKVCESNQRICSKDFIGNRTDIEQFLCDRFNAKIDKKYYSLKTLSEYPQKYASKSKQLPLEHIRMTRNFQSNSDDTTWQQFCNRGIYARTQSDNDSTTYICFCPPSYYGHLCQYQSQRVSLILNLLPFDRDSIYSIFVKLIDHHGLINSYEQFTFMSSWGCKMKFNIYLLYSTRPKDLSKNYTIHIDAFEKTTLKYYTSWSLAIPFLFLPVNRIVAQLNLPVQRTMLSHLCNLTCQNGGQCMKYENNNEFFCQCLSNWSGNQCEISSYCKDCSSVSVCVGSIDNRSICICPPNKAGPRCLLPSNCPLNACQNHGQCVLLDNTIGTNNYMCICSDEYYGSNCQYQKNKLTINIDDLPTPTHIQVYISTISNESQPTNILLVKKLLHEQNIISFYLSIPYHMVFVKIIRDYYLAAIQQTPQTDLLTSINSKQQCHSIDKFFNSTILTLPLIRRVKYYPLLCKDFNKPQCFYDEIYMCLCTNESYPNCFQFDHQSKLTCLHENYCQNNAVCLQDDPTCPSNTICICSDCYFGTQCQFYAKGFGLTLDDILRYEIRPKLTLLQQKMSIKISALITLIIFLLGLINGICSCITFQRKNSRKVGSGSYLLASSITSILTIILFTMKFWFLILSQTNILTSRLTLLIGCRSIEPLLKIFLSTDTWFNACVAMERAILVYKGVHFHQQTSRKLAKRIIILLPLVITSTFIHEPIYRGLFNDEEEQRIWCVTYYNKSLQNYNSTVILIHFLSPFIINLCSALYIIINVSRRRNAAQSKYTYFQHLYQQFREYKHILISPLVLVILSSPRLIISLMSTCIKSSQNSWLFLSGYFISFIPSMLVFIIFVLPSDLYKKEFQESIQSWFLSR